MTTRKIDKYRTIERNCKNLGAMYELLNLEHSGSGRIDY